MPDDVKAILERPTCSVAEYGQVVGVSKNPAYESVKRGEVPIIRVGGKIRVLTTPLKVKLGLSQPATSAA